MIALGDLALLRLPWLAALPLVALLAVLAARRAAALGGWERAVDPALLAALQRLGRVVPGSGRRTWLPAATAALIALALVGPARETRSAATFRNLDGLVLVVDLSRSLAEGGHLAQALTAARLVAERAGSRPVALVVYAGDAYLASPFTTDAAVLGTVIAMLDGETVPDAGSRPARGLALAARTLRDAGVVAGDVVLVTDGGGLSGEERSGEERPGEDAAAAAREAERIAAAGGRLSTLFVRPTLGPPGQPLPERGPLDALARLGGGVAGTALAPLPVAEAVGDRQAVRLARGDFAVLFWTDYGRHLLLLALLPALALFRQRA